MAMGTSVSDFELILARCGHSEFVDRGAASMLPDVAGDVLPRQLTCATAFVGAVHSWLPQDVRYTAAQVADVPIRPLRLPDSLGPGLSKDTDAATEGDFCFGEFAALFDLLVSEPFSAHIEQELVTVFASAARLGDEGLDRTTHGGKCPGAAPLPRWVVRVSRGKSLGRRGPPRAREPPIAATPCDLELILARRFSCVQSQERTRIQ